MTPSPTTTRYSNARTANWSWSSGLEKWHNGLKSRAVTWVIDLGLLTVAAGAVITQQVVLGFHLIFALVVVAALQLPFRPFVTRLAFWLVVSTGLVIWAVTKLETPSQELTELPILTFVLILVFLVAQSRAHTVDKLDQARRDAESRALSESGAMRTQLEESQRLDVLGRASTRTAHEMRNVLTIVRGCAAELIDETEASVRQKADEVLDAVDRGLELLNELMAAGRANRMPPEALDLAHTLQHTKVLLAHLLHDGIELRCVVPGTPLLVEIERSSFAQIVMNLVTNAADAIDASGRQGVIDVSVRELLRHRTGALGLERCAAITVSDSGDGLDVDNGDVFDPGFTTKSGTHSGLGLPMVWQIAMRAGGTVEIDSVPGDGTTVNVYLPLAGGAPHQRRCLVGVSDGHAAVMISHEFDLLGYHVYRAAEIGPSDRFDADVAVFDADHPPGPTIGTRIARLFLLDSAGPWRSPSTPTDAATLVRQIQMDVSAPPSQRSNRKSNRSG